MYDIYSNIINETTGFQKDDYIDTSKFNNCIYLIAITVGSNTMIKRLLIKH